MTRPLGLTITLVLLGLFVVSCAPGPASATTPPAVTSQQASAATSRLVSAEELAGALGQKDFLLVNVHVPYQGEIDGTDLFVAYDQIGSSLARLPQDKGAKIVLYCRSGNMSATAAKTLVAAGYTNVLDLKGGMEAWKDAGYQILERAR
jgi:rhodanese-related sulfurtransferase